MKKVILFILALVISSIIYLATGFSGWMSRISFDGSPSDYLGRWSVEINSTISPDASGLCPAGFLNNFTFHANVTEDDATGNFTASIEEQPVFQYTGPMTNPFTHIGSIEVPLPDSVKSSFGTNFADFNISLVINFVDLEFERAGESAILAGTGNWHLLVSTTSGPFTSYSTICFNSSAAISGEQVPDGGGSLNEPPARRDLTIEPDVDVDGIWDVKVEALADDPVCNAQPVMLSFEIAKDGEEIEVKNPLTHETLYKGTIPASLIGISAPLPNGEFTIPDNDLQHPTLTIFNYEGNPTVYGGGFFEWTNPRGIRCFSECTVTGAKRPLGTTPPGDTQLNPLRQADGTAPLTQGTSGMTTTTVTAHQGGGQGSDGDGADAGGGGSGGCSLIVDK